MRQCTTSPQKRRRTQESLIREGGKSDAALCIKLWKRCRRTTPLRHFRRDLRANGHELKPLLTDNGPEFLHADKIEASLRAPVHYCHPYHAWEKGSIERHNRLVRTFHHKPTDFSKLSPHTLRQTHHLIVHYPRSPRRPPDPCNSSTPPHAPCAIPLTFYNDFLICR